MPLHLAVDLKKKNRLENHCGLGSLLNDATMLRVTFDGATNQLGGVGCFGRFGEGGGILGSACHHGLSCKCVSRVPLCMVYLTENYCV